MLVHRLLCGLLAITLVLALGPGHAADTIPDHADDPDDDDHDQFIPSPSAIRFQVKRLTQIDDIDARQRAMADLPLILQVRCVTASPALRDPAIASRAAVLLAPLLDPDTPARDLGPAIDAIERAQGESADLRRALRQLQPDDFVMVYDRIAEARLAEAERDRQLSLLSRLRPATAFVPILLGGAVVLADGAEAETLRLRHAIPWQLVRLLIEDRQWTDALKDELRRAVDKLPAVVTEAVGRIVAELPAELVQAPSPVETDVIEHVRRLYPYPYDRIFPYGDHVVERLVDDLSVRQPSLLLDLDLIETLARLGLRLRQHRLVALYDADDDERVLDRIYRLVRHDRHLFDRVSLGRHLRTSLRQHSERFTASVDARPVPGSLAYLERHLNHLLPLLRHPSFIAYLRRHPEQVYALLAALFGRGHHAVLAGVADLPLMAAPELCHVADAALRLMLGQCDGRDDLASVYASAIRHLVRLSSIDLYKANVEGRAPLTLLAPLKERKEYAWLWYDPVFLQILVTSNDDQRSSLDPDGRRFVQELKRSAPAKRLRKDDWIRAIRYSSLFP